MADIPTNPVTPITNGALVSADNPLPAYLVGGVPATSITVGSTTVAGGTTTRVLYDNAGVLGEYATVPAANGGTGIASYAVGDIVYADTTTSLAKLADIAAGNALISGGVGAAPSYGKIGLTTHVSGTLPVANGGTGDTGTAWTAYTPSITVGSGSITTLGAVSGLWKSIGKTVFVKGTVTVTTNGTAAGFIAASLPVASSASIHSYGSGALGTGAALIPWVIAGDANGIYLRNYDGTYTFADGTNYSFSAVYEAA